MQLEDSLVKITQVRLCSPEKDSTTVHDVLALDLNNMFAIAYF
jgi:hypothetical protein